MAFIIDNAYDSGLSYVTTNGSRIDICSAEPTTYAQATSTNTLGNKTALTVGSPTNGDTSGRKVVIPAITDGSVTASGTATHWALTDGTSTLIATGALSASQAVTSGNTFSLGAIDVTFPDVVAA